MEILVAVVVLVAIAVAVLIYLHHFDSFPKNQNQILGVSFSSDYATDLGLDYQKVFKTILDDWGFRHIRLSAQWNEVERERGKFHFNKLDWLMNEAAKRGAKVILAVGHKTPRWPECHLPDWAMQLPYGEAEYDNAANNYVSTVVERYKNHSALEVWQVENEPFLHFGECPNFNEETFDQELELVRLKDMNHPLMVSDSGELSSWKKTAPKTELFGTTLYRVVWHKWLGYLNYDWLPPAFYRYKLKFNKRSLDTFYIMELQAEPWLPNGSVTETPLLEQYKSMNFERLQKHIDFAARVGAPRSYLWGAEWWYWLNERGNGQIVNYIKTLDKNNKVEFSA